MDADLQILSPAPCVTHGDSGDDLYATSEERKQRNRQAQAAFRERRTEYIKQLEATIKQNEEVLQTLHQNHRTAADECMMLRYKNSLLERILLEKGIDVQAELAMQNFSRQRFGTAATAAPPMAQQPALAYTAEPTHIMGGHRKIAMAPAPKPGHQYHRSHDGYVVHSPQLQPTPPSRLSSPGMCAETSAFGGSTGYRELQAQHHHVPLAMSPSAGTMLADYDAVQQTVMPSPASTTDQSRFSNSG
ncbi:hypothetical protein KEM52_000442, partial [Ascosphaera acerosa]